MMASLRRSRGIMDMLPLLVLKRGGVSLMFVVAMVLACTIGPWVLPYNARHIDLQHHFLPPFSGGHVLGTDEIGRDSLARLLMGGRASLEVGLTATAISATIGMFAGILTGTAIGGRAVRWLLRVIVNLTLCFPAIFLLLTLASIMGPSVSTIIIIISFVIWTETTRVADIQTRTLMQKDFVAAAIGMGATRWHIIMREILPNVLPVVTVTSTLNLARAILLEAYVSYLGYGVQPPDPSWGSLLNNAQEYLVSDPWLAVLPGLAITLTVTAIGFVGEAVRDGLGLKRDQE